MKNRSVQAIAIGLSVMSLAVGPVGATAYAYAAEMQNETEIASEQDISESEKTAITGDKEQNIYEESTDEELVGSFSAVVDVVEKEVEAPVANSIENQEENPPEITDDLKEDIPAEPDAAAVIAGADKTIEDARTALGEAESRYNEAIESYDAAKAAIDEDVLKSTDAAEKIRNAEDTLNSAQKELDIMAGDIETEKDRFVSAVADNMLYLMPEPVPDEKELVKTVLSSVEIKTESEKCIAIEYNAIDETGEIVHFIVILDKIDKTSKRKGLLAGNLMEIPGGVTPSIELKSKEISYKVVDNTIWELLLTNFLPYVKDVKAKFNAYNDLLESIKVKQADVQTAQDRVTIIKAQIEALKAINSGAHEGISGGGTTNTITQESHSGQSTVTDQTAGNKVIEDSNSQNSVEANNIAEESTVDSGKIAYNTIEKSSVEDSTKISDNNSAKKKSDKVVQPQDIMPVPDEIVTIDEENIPLAITLAGMIQHAKWFIALGGVSLAGGLVGLIEVKRRAATKVIDKLNQ